MIGIGGGRPPRTGGRSEGGVAIGSDDRRTVPGSGDPNRPTGDGRALSELLGPSTLVRELFRIQEQEKSRLARELHDELGQELTGLRLLLERASAPTVGNERRAGLLREAIALVGDLQRRARGLALDLRPPSLDDLGLARALADLADRFRQRTGIGARLEIDGEPGDVPAEVATAVFRIVQEALTNVARHAEAERVTVVLGQDDSRLLVSVRDEGRGFRPETTPEGRLGLVGMRSRAEQLGGRFDVSSIPGAGTRIEVRIPLSAAPLPPRREDRGR